MRVTTFTLDSGGVRADSAAPTWTEVNDFDSHADLGNLNAGIRATTNGDIALHRIPAGRYFPIHASEKFASVLVLEGSGTTVLPNGVERTFTAPELLVFDLRAPHGFRATEDTLFFAAHIEATPDEFDDLRSASGA